VESGGELSETEARHSVAKRCKLVWLWRELFRDAEREKENPRRKVEVSCNLGCFPLQPSPGLLLGAYILHGQSLLALITVWLHGGRVSTVVGFCEPSMVT